MKILNDVVRLYRAYKMLTSDELLSKFFSDGAVPSSSGELITTQTAMQVAAVYACTRVASETLGALPCVVYRKLPDGGKERLPDHPLWKVLHDQPNQWQTAMEFYEMMQACIELKGNAYAFIVRVRGQVRELIPLHPDRVWPEQQKNFTILYKVSMPDGSLNTYTQKEMLHVKFLSNDGIVGISPIKAQRDTIGIARSQDKFSASTYKNGARPSGVVSMDGTLKDESYERIRKNWNANYSGDNTGKVAILEQGLKWEAMSMTAEDAQFIESKKFSRSEIAAIFRIPPHKIGDLERATFSNIEHQGVQFVTDSMLPRARRWEFRFKMQLVTEPDVFVEFQLDGLLRGDTKSRMLYYEKGIQNGFLSPNEVRVLENRLGYDGGDKFIPAENLFGKKKTNGKEEDDDEDNKEPKE